MHIYRRAETINLFDLGYLYVAALGTKGDTAETAEVQKYKLKFTPSRESSAITDGIEIKKMSVASVGTQVGQILDLFTGKADGTVTAGKLVRITGSRLKISGTDGGVFFAKCDGDGKISGDESTYIRVEPEKIARNLNKTLEFFLPESLETDSSYKILLKSNCTSGNYTRKDYQTTETAAVTVK